MFGNSKPPRNSLFSNPGKNSFLNFWKNWVKNKLLKFCIVELLECSDADVVEKLRYSGFSTDSILSIPLNPLMQSTKEVGVLDKYVIISSSTLSSPYVSGQPTVETTLIVESKANTLEVKVVLDFNDSLLKASISLYFFKLLTISKVPPWCSNER